MPQHQNGRWTLGYDDARGKREPRFPDDDLYMRAYRAYQIVDVPRPPAPAPLTGQPQLDLFPEEGKR